MGAAVYSVWDVELDLEILTDLEDEIQAMGEDPGYDDSMIEDPDYGTTLDFAALSHLGFTGSAGIMLRPIPQLDLGLVYIHGVDVDTSGKLNLAFGCPPTSDALGRFGSESFGLCNSRMTADASVAYQLPARINAGLALRPTSNLRLEFMAGWVDWSAFDDFLITITGAEEYNDLPKEESADLVNQTRRWARANQDSYWGGLDLKLRPVDRLLLGTRVLLDSSAIPDEALSPNNYDANNLMLSLLGAWKASSHAELGLSLTQHFLASRQVDDSAFLVTLDDSSTPEDRWNYPQMNGSYRGWLTRCGISLHYRL